jgi:glycosyltransferase involved in cell wall biosynthesis
MNSCVSVIMPAYAAENTVVPAVRSLLAQTWSDWVLHLVADDGQDYETLLGRAGIADKRLRFWSSGGIRSGCSAARNAGLEQADTALVALLDADDRFKPDKLARSVAGAAHAGVVTSGLELFDSQYRPQRTVGDGQDGLHPAARHKWINFSGDSTLLWDRTVTDARYDSGMRNLADLDFVLRLYRHTDRFFHLGAPLYDYVKFPNSMSNAQGVTARMIAAKTLIRDRLMAGHYDLDAEIADGFRRFLDCSLMAESSFDAALAAQPGLLFEDHMQPLLVAV